MDGSQWLPYQHVTVLTPPFPEYISGHSTFSSAGAKILQAFTGGDTFGAYVTVEKDSSKFEANTPATDIVFTWPTFTNTLDDAGFSRRIGGIHFASGDAHGRAVGTQVGNVRLGQGAAVHPGHDTGLTPAARTGPLPVGSGPVCVPGYTLTMVTHWSRSWSASRPPASPSRSPWPGRRRSRRRSR